MKKDDFRHMRGGKQIAALREEEFASMLPIHQSGEGKTRALLMLHGFTSSPAVYRQMIPHIKHYDAIVCPMLPGHAESIESFSKSTAQDWLKEAARHCEELTKTYEQVDILGLSLGGLLTCYLSKHYTFNHIYLLAPALALHLHLNTSLNLARFLYFLGFRQLRNAAGDMLNTKQSEISYRRIPVETIIEILAFINDFKFETPPCPVDLFLGCHDRVVNSVSVNDFFEGIDQIKVHWLEHSAHVLPLDNDVEYILDCINQNNEKRIQGL